MKSWALAARAAAIISVIGRVQPPVADVLGDRPAEQRRLLGHEADALAQAGHRHVADVRRHRSGSCPSVTSHRRGMSPTRVVLPDPDGPTRARVSPAPMSQRQVAQDRAVRRR